VFAEVGDFLYMYVPMACTRKICVFSAQRYKGNGCVLFEIGQEYSPKRNVGKIQTNNEEGN
jgi:hypothetical protein